jgi:hypothetical protein
LHALFFAAFLAVVFLAVAFFTGIPFHLLSAGPS